MARVISQAVDELGNFYILKDDGTLEKTDSLSNLLWSVNVTQEPSVGIFVYANQVLLDINDNIWLTYSDQLNIQIRNTSDGSFAFEVLGTASNVEVTQAGGVSMYAISTSRGILYEIDQASRTLNRSFDLSDVVPGWVDGIFISEICTTNLGKIWFPALIGQPIQPRQAALVQFDPTAAGTFTVYPITGDLNVPVIAVGCDVTGLVYGCTLHGSVYRFNTNIPVVQYDYLYDPLGQTGVVDIVTFTNANQPVLVDDGTFAFVGGSTRIMDPANGNILSTTPSSNVGSINGDVMGYSHIKLTRINVPPPAVTPIVDSNKLFAWVKSDGSLSFVGMPGAVKLAVSIQLIQVTGPVTVATVTPNSDGSFSYNSAPGVGNPAGEALQVKAINGAQSVTKNLNSVPRGLPSGFVAQMQTSGFIMTGVTQRIKALVTSGGSPVTPSPGVFPFFRIKRASDGHWFNGLGFVPDNGDYLQASFDTDDQFWFMDVLIPAGITDTASFIVKDSPPYAINLMLIPQIAEEADLQTCLTTLNELNAKVDIAFGSKAAQYTDPTTIGGFIFERLNDIQRVVHQTLRGIIGTQNVVIESILTDVDAQSVPKGSTPTIDIFVYQQNRRFPLDLNGSQIFFIAKANLSSPVQLINEPATIVDGLGGHCQVQLTSSDTGTPQTLNAQIVVITPGSGTLISPPFLFEITDSVL